MYMYTCMYACTVLWQLMRHYGIPEKIINIIRSTCTYYDGMQCMVVREGLLSEAFPVTNNIGEPGMSTVTIPFSVDSRLDNSRKEK